MTKHGTRRALLLSADGWTLPPEIRGAAARLDRVRRARDAIGSPPTDPFGDVVAAIVEADHPADVAVTAIVDHPRRLAEHDARSRALTAAVTLAEDALTDTIRDRAGAVLTAHLAPALAGVWADVVANVEALGALALTDRAGLLAAPTAARKAALRLDELAADYARLRMAAGALPLAAPELDVDGEFAELSDGLRAVWPEWTPHRPGDVAPWPTDPAERLVWLVRQGVTPWLADGPARDAAWSDRYPQHAAALDDRRRIYAGHQADHRARDRTVSQQYRPRTAPVPAGAGG